MQHIKQAMQRILINNSKVKFFEDNENKFLQYFDSLDQYKALIRSGNFDKMQEIIKDKSTFNVDNFINSIKKK
jgi:hypothetical protein